MRPRSWSFWSPLLLAWIILALVASSVGPGLNVAAQIDETSLDGSPTIFSEPESDSAPPDDPVIEFEQEEVAEPAVSLVEPVAITVDTTRLESSTDPCASIDPSWFSVSVDFLLETYWTVPDGSAGGNVFVEWATQPATISWDSLGGGTVWAAIVPDAMDLPAVAANLYDYRPYGGSVGGDAGLVAPSGSPTFGFLCLTAPPATSTTVPTAPIVETEAIAEAVNEPVVDTKSPTNEAVVQPAAIGVGSSVRISEPLNLRQSPSLTGTVLAVLSPGTIVTVVGGPQTASGYTWWQLATPSGTGWSVADYLIEQPAVSTPTRTATRTPTRTPTGVANSIGIGSTVRVTQALNLRSAPGTSAGIVSVMPTGTIGTVLGGPQSASGMTWWQLSTSLGTGWAAGNYLAIVSGGATPTTTRTPSVTGTATMSRTPSVTGTATITRTPSMTGTATTTRTPSMTGTAVPLTATASATSTATRPAGSIAIRDLVRTTASVNFRTAAGTQSTVIVVLPSGTQGAVVGGPTSATGYVWWQIQTTSGIGWVAANYLSRVGAAPTATNTRTPSVSATPSITSTATVSPTASMTRTPSLTPTITRTPSVTPTVGSCGTLGYGDIARTTTSVNFRSTPSTSGAIIRTLSEGERGTVRGGPTSANGYTWCQLQIGTATGWVANQYLARVSGPVPTPNGTVTPRPDTPTPPAGGSAMVLYNGSRSSGMIALTYDAGAGRGQAAYILDTLARYGVVATFGMTGTWARDNPDLVARMVAEGHQLINHTWSHPSFTGGSSSTTVLTRSARLDQLDRTEAIVAQQTGYQMKPYWRPPYGDINASVLQDVYASGYYVTVMWTCDTLAWNGASEQQILNRCMYPMGAGDIILMHVGSDGLDWAATDNMIEYFLGRGLRLVTIEEMLAG